MLSLSSPVDVADVLYVHVSPPLQLHCILSMKSRACHDRQTHPWTQSCHTGDKREVRAVEPL